jgi:hypothetical protein
VRLLHVWSLITFSVCLAAAVLPFNQALAAPPQAIVPFVSSCATDGEISADERATLDQTAMQFVQTILSSNPTAAYSNFTADAKQNVSLENVSAMIQQGIQPMAPYTNVHVVHTYLAKVTGGTQEQRVVCGNLSSPEGWVTVTAKPGPQQGHVIVESQTRNNTWAFVIWLLQEQGHWHVQYFQVMIVEMVGKSAQDLLVMARTQQQRHHNFNACALYATALQLAGRGPNLQLGIQPEIQKEMAQLEVPREIQGQPPFTWQFGNAHFKVLTVGPIGVGGHIYLSIEQEVAHWTDNNDAERENQKLIAAFKKAYPEYLDVFAGLVVAAREAGGTRGYRTVDVKPESSK